MFWFRKKEQTKVLPTVPQCSRGHEWHGVWLSWRGGGRKRGPFCMLFIADLLERESGTKLKA